MSEGRTIVRAVGLRREFPSRGGVETVPVVDGVSLEVRDGEFVAIVGRSGCGKTTLLQMLGGLDAVDGGELEVAGTDLVGADERARARFRRRHLGFVFQSFHLVPTLTVLENVGATALIDGRRREDWAPEASRLLDDLGLASLAPRLPQGLSGGQQQRVAVARALFGSPDVLMADEPTGDLDSSTGATVLTMLRSAVESGAVGCALMVTHDAVAASRTDRAIALADGRVVAQLDVARARHDQEGAADVVERVHAWMASLAR